MKDLHLLAVAHMEQPPDLNQRSGNAGLDESPTAHLQMEWSSVSSERHDEGPIRFLTAELEIAEAGVEMKEQRPAELEIAEAGVELKTQEEQRPAEEQRIVEEDVFY